MLCVLVQCQVLKGVLTVGRNVSLPASLALTGCYGASELWVRLDDAFGSCSESGVVVWTLAFFEGFD